jgi:hypothetical protein
LLIGRSVAANGERRGLQFGHAELVEQLVIGAVGADRRQRVGNGLARQLVAEGKRNVCAGDVTDPDFAMPFCSSELAVSARPPQPPATRGELQALAQALRTAGVL